MESGTGSNSKTVHLYGPSKAQDPKHAKRVQITLE